MHFWEPDLTPEEMLGFLAKVELTYDEKTNEIVAPTFRQDIHYVADVAEEIARFFGYDKIPTTLANMEKLQQVNCHSSFVLKLLQEISQNTADSLKA